MCLISFVSCVDEGEFWAIAPGGLLHGNGAKVWLLAHDLQHDNDFTPFQRRKKETFLFFEDGDFYIQRIDKWGEDEYRKGTFSFHSEKGSSLNYLNLYFLNGTTTSYKIITYSDNLFELELASDSTRRLVLTSITKPE